MENFCHNRDTLTITEVATAEVSTLRSLGGAVKFEDISEEENFDEELAGNADLVLKLLYWIELASRGALQDRVRAEHKLSFAVTGLGAIGESQLLGESAEIVGIMVSLGIRGVVWSNGKVETS